MSILSVGDQGEGAIAGGGRSTIDVCGGLSYNAHIVRERAIAFIDRNLLSPQLRPSSVAEGVGVSRAVLYRAFQIDGGVASFLHERRLAKARLMLETRAGEPGVIQKVAAAHGYASAVRFSRLFASRYDEQPARYVRKVRASAQARAAVVSETVEGQTGAAREEPVGRRPPPDRPAREWYPS